METQELAGRRLGDRYLLEEPIASGGMATVWRATDVVLGRLVAVKILRDDLARDAGLLERFRLEAVAAARLSHPAVVRVFDTGVDGVVCFIVMELFEGGTLASVLEERGPLPPEEAVRVAEAALQGLAHAHREGVIHRDVKPSNILVDSSGGVKVTDFGIAKAAFAGGDVTTTGNLLGTARYLAPEQVGGGQVDGRTDLYALGIVLYEALTGKTPFEAETHLATATMRLTTEPAPPGALRPGIPRPLEAAVVRALARDPEDRFESAEEMRAALDRAIPAPAPRHRGERRPRPQPHRERASFFRSWMLVPLLLVVVAALAVAGVFLFDNLLTPAGQEDGSGGQPAVRPLELAAAGDYDPAGDFDEYGEDVGMAIDDSPTSAWTTEGYDQADMDKEGVGIFVDLGSPQGVGGVRVRTLAPGWEFEIRGSNDPESFTEQLASRDGESTFVTEEPVTRVRLEAATYRYVLIWVTELSEPGPPFRATIAEIDVLPPA